MSAGTAEVVICGAGMAGVAAAYHLAVRRGIEGVVLVDERPALSLTSDKSAESYRNWWPGPGDSMVALMNRSIDLMEELAAESGNVFLMNRRGYLFATAQPEQIDRYVRAAEDAAGFGAGPVRMHGSSADTYQPAPATGYEKQPIGTDVITEPSLIRRHFPYLAQDTVALLHARRCGWFSGQQLGMCMLERARDKGVRLIEGRVERVETAGGRVTGVTVSGRDGTRTIGTARFVNAAGPFLKDVGRLLGIELPVFCERHAKVAFHDTLGVVPRHAPMMIWTDPVRLPWSDDERAELGEAEALRPLLDEMPAGVHGRPEGGGDSPIMLGVWTYHAEPMEARFPIEFDPAHAEIVLRGLTRPLPGLSAPTCRACRSTSWTGATTPRHRRTASCPCPLPVEGAYLLGGLSGYGMMSSNGAADLLADYIAERPLPHYAPAFHLDRYQDPAYQKLLASWGDSGQL